MGKGSAKQEVAEYFMSIHQGVCMEADAITEVMIGEKTAWTGNVTAAGPIYINAPDLFGGIKKEGGVGGAMYFLPGGRDQVMPEALANRLGLTSQTCPGFRGIASIFFVGVDTYGSVAPPSGGGGGDVGGGTGGGGSSGGGGGGGGGCVHVDSFMPGSRMAGEMTTRSSLLVLDYDDMDRALSKTGIITGIDYSDQPCVEIVSASGIPLIASESTPTTYRDGEMGNILDCLGRKLPVEDKDGFRWEEIISITGAGIRPVAHIHAGGATFAAGKLPYRYIYTHNLYKENMPIE